MPRVTSRFEKARALADTGVAYRAKVQEEFRRATERLDTEARVMPDDKPELREEQETWMRRFNIAMVSPIRSSGKANQRLCFRTCGRLRPRKRPR